MDTAKIQMGNVTWQGVINTFKDLFVYFWLHWLFVVHARAFSSCGEWGLLFVAVHRLLTVLASLVAEHGFRYAGFSSCSADLVTPHYVGFSQTKVQTIVPCIGKQTLNH